MSETLLNVGTPDGLLDAMINHGVSPAMLHGITPEQLEAIYSLCHDDLAAERFEEGRERAAFLVSQEPWDRRFHMAYAFALQHLGQYESAGRFYSNAYGMDATDAVCALRIGECLGALNEFEEAREAFDAALKLSWKTPEFEDVREKAQGYLDHLTSLGV